MKNSFKMGGVFYVTCYDKNGKIKWKECSKNRVVTVGLEHVLDTIFSLGGELAHPNYYIGMTDASPTIVSGDTLASHAGWNEVIYVTDYSENTRQEFNEVRTGQTVDNSASKAVFSIVNNTTVGGAFICSADTGTGGMLLAVSAFANGDKPVSSGDTVEIEYSFSATST